jgi:hypothetical protein
MLFSIEKLAVEFVFRYERSCGRNPRPMKEGGCDISSDGRFIEVKGQKQVKPARPRQYWLILDHRCLRKLWQEKNYFVYLVYNLNPSRKLEGSRPELVIIPREELVKDLDPSWINTVDEIVSRARQGRLRFEPKWEIHLGRERLLSLRIQNIDYDRMFANLRGW